MSTFSTLTMEQVISRTFGIYSMG